MTSRGSAESPGTPAHRHRLLQQMATISSRGLASSPLSSPRLRGSPVRPVSTSFDGRRTLSSPQRLSTPGRSRRIAFPTGVCTPGKENSGIVLEDRLKQRQLYISPPREPRYVNDARKGSVCLAVLDVPSPCNAPKRQEFARAAEARGMGGVFPRSHAGCLPYCP